MSRYSGMLVAVAMTVMLTGTGAAQQIDRGLGKVNPFVPLIDPKTGSPTKPFEVPTPNKPVPDPHLYNNPFPTQPWSRWNPPRPQPWFQPGVERPWFQTGVERHDYGTVVQYITVPSQPLSLSLYAPVPEGVPPRTEQRVVEIPGYYVTETTTGYYFPGRWTLQQLNVGVYRWLWLPAEFRPKALGEIRPPAVIR